nr:uncharacterized protein LOC109167446 [Ipomoea trifida]
MKQLSSSTIIGTKRKLPSSSTKDNFSGSPNNDLESPLLIYGVFQQSLVTPLSVLTNGNANDSSARTIADTPTSSVNATRSSNKSLPFTDITNVNGTMRSKKIKGSLALTGVSTVDNTLNGPICIGNTKSCGMYIPRATNNQDSNQEVVIPRDLSQDFDEVIENNVHAGT